MDEDILQNDNIMTHDIINILLLCWVPLFNTLLSFTVGVILLGVVVLNVLASIF